MGFGKANQKITKKVWTSNFVKLIFKAFRAMKINLTLSENHNFDVIVKTDDLVEVLKQKLFKEFKIKKMYQRFLYNGSELNCKSSFSNYNILDGSKIKLMIDFEEFERNLCKSKKTVGRSLLEFINPCILCRKCKKIHKKGGEDWNVEPSYIFSNIGHEDGDYVSFKDSIFTNIDQLTLYQYFVSIEKNVKNFEGFLYVCNDCVDEKNSLVTFFV